MALLIESAPMNGREVTLYADLAPFDYHRFFARGRYDAKRGWVVRRELIGQKDFELLNVNALGWLP